MTSRRPNVLYILSDQHNPSVLGSAGDPVAETPHLDRLASNGVTFDSAYCPSPICVPSRMSMLTGRHPYQNEAWTNDHVLDSGIPTFAHALGAAGYETTLVGRMHSVGPDQLRGYGTRLVGDHGSNFPGGHAASRGILNGTSGPERVSLLRSGPGRNGYQDHDEDVTRVAVDELHRLARRTSADAVPFCLSLGLMLPHQPYVADPDDYHRFLGRVPPVHHDDAWSDVTHPYLRWWRRETGIEEVTPAEAQRARAAYWALVSRMDMLIGLVLDALQDTGLAENTLVVYTSDHGDQLGEHGLWWKQTYYEGSVRVPAILSWPGVIPAGTRSDRVVSALDVTATILDACRAPALPDSTGRSLLALTQDPATSWEDEAFSEYCTDAGWITRMVRSGPWKLNYYHGHPVQLFHLADDPDELVDRADDPAVADVRERLVRRALDGWDPDGIAMKMERKRAQGDLLRQWASRTRPADQHRWDLRPEMMQLYEDVGADRA